MSIAQKLLAEGFGYALIEKMTGIDQNTLKHMDTEPDARQKQT